jgi:stage V sporulation protein B
MNDVGRTTSVAARGTVQLFAARACFMASGYVISLILARGLGPAEYGAYGVIMSILLWIEMVGSAGVPGAVATLLPQQGDRAASVEPTARIVLLVWSVVLFCSCWIAAPFLARMFSMPEATGLFRIAFLDIPFNGLYVVYQGVLNGNRRFGMLSVTFVAYTLTKLGGIIVLLLLGLSTSGAFLVNVLATLGAIVYLVHKAPPRGWSPDRALLAPMLRIALAMGSYILLLQVLLSLDLWMLQSLWTGGREVIGYYVAALNVAKLPLVVPSVLTGVLFSSIAWARAAGDTALAQRYLQAAGRFVLVVLFPCCALVVTHAEPIMSLLYSNTYAGGGVYLSVQIVAFGAVSFLDAYLHALMAIHKRGTAVAILVALVPVAAVLNILLIPRWGAFGAALSLALTIVAGTVAAMLATAREFGALLAPLTLLRVGAATAVMLLIGAQVSITGPWLLVKLSALLGLYVVLLGVLKELTRQDLHPFALWARR